MKITLARCSDTFAAIQPVWSLLRRSNLELSSPFFAPEFTQIIAAVRSDVEVAVLEDAGRIVAIFPFEHRRFNIAGPVGSFISDYHGIICAPDFTCDLSKLLRSCGLVAWDFSHALVSQTFFIPFHREQHRSPIMDLSAGFKSYVKERREAGTEQIRKNDNVMRKLEREVGPLRFVAYSSQKALLHQLLAWKTYQFRHNRWCDLFSIPWVRRAIEGIHATQTSDFAGMLSALYAGDHLVALHFGMRSATICHYWFPAYNPAFSKYSPGIMLLLKVAEAAPALGISTIDMGCGEHSYKWRLMNGFVPIAAGSVELTCTTTIARRAWAPVSKLPFKARCLISKTPVGALARRVRDGA